MTNHSSNGVEYSLHHLPLTTLHVLKYGAGPPLVLVPATISEINSWLNLVLFMGRRYTVYFFELPGHGLSTPFVSPFSTALVSETVKDLVDHLEIEQFALMGFSFGGMLTMRIMASLSERITRLLLYAPLVNAQAINLKISLKYIRPFFPLLLKQSTQRLILSVFHSQSFLKPALDLLKIVGLIEYQEGLLNRLAELPASTLNTLLYQFSEILGYTPTPPKAVYSQPCHFGMSTQDPLLDFSKSYHWVSQAFPRLTTQFYDFTFHQPPKPFTLAEYEEYFLSYLNN